MTLTDDERVLDFSGLQEQTQKLEALAAGCGVKRTARDFLLVFLEQMQKLLALADEFGVKLDEPHGWILLAYHLAIKHVPGFSGPPPRRGDHREALRWTDGQAPADRTDRPARGEPERVGQQQGG